MSDYISKTLLLRDIAVVASMMDDPIKIYDQMSAIVKESPTANVIKRRSGRWIMKEVITKEFGRLIVCQCSKCKKNQTFQTKCCSNCGAEMEFDKGWYGRCMTN